jgi:hypothetical protein
MRCRRSQNRTTKSWMSIKSRGNLEAPLPKKIHPELGTGIERFGYSGFKRKFLFLISTAHLYLTPVHKEYFVARQRNSPKFAARENLTVQRIKGGARVILHRNRHLKLLPWRQFSAARDGFSFAICCTVARSSSALKDGYEQIRLLQANAAGSPRSGYSTSGLGSLPSRRSSHSRRL